MTRFCEITDYTPALHEAVQQMLDQLTPEPMVMSEEQLRRVIESPESHLFVLYEEGLAVGMITVGLYAAPTGVKGWIEDVVVDARFRGCGYGRRLVEEAVAFARSQGVDHLMLTSNPARKAANALYQALGFEQRTTNCYKMEL